MGNLCIFFLFRVPYKVKHGSSKKCWSVLRGQYLCYYKSEDDAVSNFPKIQYNCALSGLLCVPFLGSNLKKDWFVDL